MTNRTAGTHELGTSSSNAATSSKNSESGRCVSAGRRYLYCLVAEDNPVDQTLAVRVLEGHGHKVVVTSTGKEALAAFEKHPFDIVLMDIRMPEMDGFETIAAIRERERHTGERVPIIAMTSFGIGADRARWLDAGIDSYIAKPIHSTKVGEVIEALLSLSNADERPAGGPSGLNR